ncbi:MAG: glycosyltransferase [Prevotellaceae bacterium]|jgi:glycosyltransferase involved in cell wall biosynthesis|nr:glycosyltransferase [Prevotellaceae bacterium]
MNILLISRGYPSKRDLQWGCFERDQALALQVAGHKVIIMIVEINTRLYWQKLGISHSFEDGLDIYRINLPFPYRFISLISYKWTHFIRQKLALILYKKIEKEQGKPDILYAHYLNNIAVTCSIKNKYGIPLVGLEHWSELTKEKIPQYMQRRGNLAYNGADKIIAVSDSLRRQILYHFNKESFVLHNMIGEEFVSHDIRIGRELDSPVRYVAVGSLIRRKGFDILIDAFAKSDLKEKGATITIIGKGVERNVLQQQISSAGLINNIFLVGVKSKKEIIEILKDSDVFILSSLAETFGVVCIEAMCLGLPVIATVCGGPEEFINEKNGILVPVNDVEALSSALVEMYNNINNYDRDAIANNCRARFSPHVIAEKLTTVFEDVIESRGTE